MQNQSLSLAIFASVLVFISIVFVSVRFYTRFIFDKTYGYDDFLLIISLILFFVFAGFVITTNYYGLGNTIKDTTSADFAGLLKYWWLGSIFFTVTTATLRLSIGVFLLRLLVKPVHRYILISTLVIASLFSAFYIFLTIFQCSPSQYFWQRYRDAGFQGECITYTSIPAATVAQCVMHFCADWIMTLVPIAVLWNIRTRSSIKASIAGLLSFGLLASIAAIAKIPYTLRAAHDVNDGPTMTAISILSLLEPFLSIVAASVVVIRPLFHSVFERSRSTQISSSSYSQRPFARELTPPLRRPLTHQAYKDVDFQIRKDVDGVITDTSASPTVPSPVVLEAGPSRRPSRRSPDMLGLNSLSGTWEVFGRIVVTDSINIDKDVVQPLRIPPINFYGSELDISLLKRSSTI